MSSRSDTHVPLDDASLTTCLPRVRSARGAHLRPTRLLATEPAAGAPGQQRADPGEPGTSPIDLDQGAPDSVAINRMVRASGSYDFNTEFVIRRQSMEGVPAVRVRDPVATGLGGHGGAGDSGYCAVSQMRQP